MFSAAVVDVLLCFVTWKKLKEALKENVMKHRGIKIVSLNVNGMNNQIKRGKVLTKFRGKEEMQVIFIQETHMLFQEHENLKR